MTATAPPSPPPPRREFWGGVRAELPITLGVVPFGMIFGVLALAAGIPPLIALAMSSVVFAGSSQFIGVGLIGAATPIPVLWLTTFIVNVRHMLYSASLAPFLQARPLRWKLLLAYLLTDEAYVVTILHYEDRSIAPDNKHWYFLGAGLTLWSSWQLSTAVGVFLGAQVPASWGLDFTLALTFIGMMVPTLTTRPMLMAAVSAGAVAVAAGGLPYRLNILAAAVTGIVVGYLLEQRGRSRKQGDRQATGS